MMTQMMFLNTFIKIFQNLKKFKEKANCFLGCIALRQMKLSPFKKRKAEVSSETLQNKAIDNLKSDSYFDGNEIQIKLHKAIVTPEKQQLFFK
jgi:RNA polymerase sigma-70 factor (ECF subfamily)